MQTPPHDLTEEEAEAFRAEVMHLADALYDAQVSERMMYGCFVAVFVIGMVFDESRISDMGYYLIKILFDLALVLCSVMSYKAYQTRSQFEESYWRKVLGDMYRE